MEEREIVKIFAKTMGYKMPRESVYDKETIS